MSRTHKVPNALPDRHLQFILAVLLLALPLCAASAEAQSQPKFQLDLATSVTWNSKDGLGEDLLGLRGAYRISDRTWFEGRVGYFEPGLDTDLWLTELSLKYFWDDSGRAHWYVLGGLGTTFSELDDFGDDGLVVHAGVGTQISLTVRTFLRLEFLANWSEDDTYDDDFGHDVLVGFGWRF